jgi:hypothetical protein
MSSVPFGRAVRPLFPVNRCHLEEMSDSTGIWQFALGTTPHRIHGYCTDDVARALVVDVLHGRTLGWMAVADSVERNLRFLAEAFDPDTGRFRNMRDANRAWIGGADSEDCHARALLGLGTLLAWHRDARTTVDAGTLFVRALPAAEHLTAPRPIAAAILACAQAMRGDFPAARLTFEVLGTKLAAFFDGLDPAWPWPEDVLTYENGLLPWALITMGAVMGDAGLVRRGSDVLDWLVRVQTAAAAVGQPEGRGARGTTHTVFSPIGNRGWWPRGRKASHFDQQPIEACSIALAATAAVDATGDQRFRDAAEAAYGWFLGDNDVGAVVADVDRGGCRDGLGPGGPSENEGAESTLMWLVTLEAIRRMRTG